MVDGVGGRLAGMEITAHRGLSGLEPESTRAAYLAAIDVAERTGHSIELECDTHFSSDGVLIIHHDHDLRRTTGRPDRVHDLTLTQLRDVDWGSWKVSDPTEDQRALVTLVELLEWVHAARDRGVPVGLAVETKHPNPEGLAVDQAVLELIREHGWDGADSPIRMISFHLPAVAFAAEHLPQLRRTLLLMHGFGQWTEGDLPYGTDTIGIDRTLLLKDPDYARRLHEHGNHLHVWTANLPAEINWCVSLGATGITSDRVDVVADVLAGGLYQAS